MIGRILKARDHWKLASIARKGEDGKHAEAARYEVV